MTIEEQIRQAKKQANIEMRKADLPSYGAAYRTKVQQELKEKIAEIKKGKPDVSIREFREGKAKAKQERAEFESKNVKLSTDEWVDREEFEGLSSYNQKKMQELGIKKFNKFYTKQLQDIEVKRQRKIFEAENVLIKGRMFHVPTSALSMPFAVWFEIPLENVRFKEDKRTPTITHMWTPDNWISKTAFDNLTPEQQRQLKGRGLENFKKWLKYPPTPWPGGQRALGWQSGASKVGIIGRRGVPSKVVGRYYGAGAVKDYVAMTTYGMFPEQIVAAGVAPSTVSRMVSNTPAFTWSKMSPSERVAVTAAATKIEALSVPKDFTVLENKEAFNASIKQYKTELDTFKRDNVQIGNPSNDEWVSKSELAKMPASQQNVIRASGSKGLTEFIARNEQILKPFDVSIPDPQQRVFEKEGGRPSAKQFDVVEVFRSQDNKYIDAAKGLYHETQIDEILKDRVIVPKGLVEEWQVLSERLVYPKTLKEQTEKMADTQTFNDIINKYVEFDKKVTMAVRGKIDKAGYRDELDAFKETISPVIKTWNELDAYSIENNNQAMLTIAQLSEDAHSRLMAEVPEKGKGATAIPASMGVALLDAFVTIPTTVIGTLYESLRNQQKAIGGARPSERKEAQQKTFLGVASLGAGMGAWFLGRPYAISKNPWKQVPYTITLLVVSPKGARSLVKNSIVKLNPKKISNTALALEIDVGRATVPKTMTPAQARAFVEQIQRTWTTEMPNAVARAINSNKDVVIRDKSGTAIGHVSAFQQSYPRALFHMHPDMQKQFVSDLTSKGYIDVATASQYGGMFTSSKPAFTFAARRNPTAPGALAMLISKTDVKDLPPKVIKLLDEGKLAPAKRLFTDMGKQGKLEAGVYPLWKWYGRIARLEEEMWIAPKTRLYPTSTIPLHMKVKGVPTAMNYTQSPMSFKGKPTIKGEKAATLNYGQSLPILWVATKAALKEGMQPPTLKQLYKAEMMDFVTQARKMLPWNIELRKWTLNNEVPAVGTMTASKFTGLALKKGSGKDVRAGVHANQWIVRDKGVPWYAPKEKVIRDIHGRNTRKRVTAIVMNDKGEIMLVWDKVDKAWSLPGGRHDPSGKLGRNPWKGYVDETGAARGQVLSETGIDVGSLKKIGVYRGKPTLHSFTGSPVYLAKALSTKFDLRKFHPKQPELKRAMWWDGKSRITAYPHVKDILASVDRVDARKIDIYKHTHKELMRARDWDFSNRISILKRTTKPSVKPYIPSKKTVKNLRHDMTRDAETRIDEIVNEVAEKAEARVKADKISYKKAFEIEKDLAADEIIREYNRLPYRPTGERFKLPIYADTPEQLASAERQRLGDYKIDTREKVRPEAETALEKYIRYSYPEKYREARREPIIREESRRATISEPRTEIARRTYKGKEYNVITYKPSQGKYVPPPTVGKYGIYPPTMPKGAPPPYYPPVPVVPERPLLPPPKYPPPPPPIIWGKPVGSYEELDKKQVLASIAWKQGWAYHLIYPPYTAKYVLHSKEPFPKVKIHTGARSAYKSLVKVHGDVLPEKIFWDLGIMDITFIRGQPEGRITPRMTYTRDVKQKTKARRPSSLPRLTKTVGGMRM